ncbi:PEPxxWA-CTERM sorting domain-containing protein [Polymorphobacter megasporae]|nr:PEPxxWA-CTERM sorting domain-containing protein [Polymorphobacter sp. PAMC 29334]UAJ11952.1 PEPxxWA-CTERM sorting domain-containing protein [Polymorphobacter megasporae]
MRSLSTLAALGLALVVSAPAFALDTFKITYENPGVEHSSAGFDIDGVEDFNSRSTGSGQSFTTDFGTSGAITGSYSGLQINNADQYGGAGGSGKYAVAFDYTPSYSLTLTADPITVPNGINYFGYYLSALDTGNVVDFYKGETLVGTLNPAGVLAATISKPAYLGNPDAPFLGDNNTQPYVFINFFDLSGTFDKVVFRETTANAGYESDNHTVGFFNTISGNTIPEPSSWAMMIAGFGLVGFATRRRRVSVTA